MLKLGFFLASPSDIRTCENVSSQLSNNKNKRKLNLFRKYCHQEKEEKSELG